jgi:hypothetical protein
MTMWQLGYGIRDISRDAIVSSSPAQVCRWIKKFKKAEEEGLPKEDAVLSQRRSGRPKTATTSNVEEKVLARVKDKRKRSLRKTSAWLKGKCIKASKNSFSILFDTHTLS